MSNAASRYIPHPLISLAFIISFILFYLGGVPLFGDQDTPWHLAAGDLMRKTGDFPTRDSWSFTAEGAHWYYINWAWDLAISYIVSAVGLKGLFIFSCIFKAFIAALLCYFLKKRGGVSQDPLALTILFVSIIIYQVPGARPQMSTFLILIISHYILHRSRSENNLLNLLWLPVIALIGSNLHGSIVVGAVLFTAYFLEAVLNRNWQWAKNIVIAGFLCVPAVFLTPAGFDLITITLNLNHEVTKYIDEWKPFAFGKYWGLDAALMIFIAASNFTDRDIPIADRILTFIWFLLAIFSVRMFPIFALMSAPYLAISLEKSLIHKSKNEIPEKSRLGLAVGSVLVVILCSVIPIRWYLMQKNDVYDPKEVPVEELQFVRENYPGKRFIAEYGFSGFVIYYNHDTNKVFIDGRANSVFPKQVLSETIDLINGKNTNAIIDKYKVEGLILAKKNPAYKFPDLKDESKWQLVHEGEAALVYLRK